MRTWPAIRPNPYLLVTVASWGLNFVALKEAYKEMGAPTLALIRYVVMWAVLALICLWRRESLRYPREDILRLLYLGFVSMGVYMILFLEGMWGTSATEGSILLQMSPIFTAILLAAFGQERFSAGSLVGALVAFSGAALVVYKPETGHPHNLLSNLIVFVSALTWAYSVTIMRPLLVKYSPLRVLTLSMPGALPVILAYGLLPSLHQNWGGVSLYGWTMFFHVAIISGVVAFLCFYQGIRQVGGTGATLYQFLVPIAAMLFALVIEGAKPTLTQVLGFIVVLAGVAYASRSRQRAEPPVEVLA